MEGWSAAFEGYCAFCVVLMGNTLKKQQRGKNAQMPCWHQCCLHFLFTELFVDWALLDANRLFFGKGI
jgi:hypothetical protein